MVTKVIRTIEESGMLQSGDRVLCALSGGVDSSVLLDVLIKCSETFEISVCAAHLNHMLRGDDAMRDEEFVRQKCEKYGIEIICERADIASVAKETGESVELAARRVRYDFLERAKQVFGAYKIATAHNANDNLETMLFNISRGSGIDGLCGIPPIRGDIIRPLITVTRDEIENFARENEIEFCIDKTNDDTVYSRNKIRHNVIPALLEINSAAVRNAARSSSVLREEAAFLNEMAKKETEKIALSKTACNADELLGVPAALFARVCEYFSRRALGVLEYTLEYRHISSIRNLCESKLPSKEVALPAGLLVRREYEKIIFEKRMEQTDVTPIKLCEGEFSYGKYAISVKKIEKNGKVNNSVNTFIVSCDRIQNGLVVRKRQEGDKIKIKKRPEKTLKKLFIDERIPKFERDLIPVIADNDNVLAVFGFGQDERFFSEINDKVLEIRVWVS